MSEPFSFRLTATDGAARTGEIMTAHGVVHTPAFMPVGTQASIKGVHHETCTRPAPRFCSAIPTT